MNTYRRRTTLFLPNLLFLLVAAAAAVDGADSGVRQELEAMCTVLRSSGYNLFCNAIATSDLQVQLTANATVGPGSSIIVTAGAAFTLFAPKDKFLFTLDMASDAADYVAALRYHIVPSRLLALSDLKNLSSPFLDTLLPHYSILIYKTDNASVTVDGVMLSDPDLYIGSKIAVHGLDGILLSGYSSPYEDCDGENGPGLISSLDQVSAHHICLNFPAPPPPTTPAVPVPAATPTVPPAAPIRTAATAKVPPPLPTEKRGKVPRRAKRGKYHRQRIRSVPRRDRRRNNHTKGGEDHL